MNSKMEDPAPLGAEILFIRHAHTQLNELGTWQGRDVDPPLSQRGLSAARAAAAELMSSGDHQPRTLLVSPLQRAMQTAQVLIDEGLEAEHVLIYDDLLEADIGWMTGRTWEDFAAHGETNFDLWRRGLTPGFKDGESREQLLCRARSALDYIDGVSRPLIVSHLMILTAIRELTGLARTHRHLENLGAFGRWPSPSSPPVGEWRDLPKREASAEDAVHHG